MDDELAISPVGETPSSLVLPPAGVAAGTALPGSSADLVPGIPPPPEAPPTKAAGGGGGGGSRLVERASLAVFWNAAFLPLKLVAKLVASIIVIRVLRSDGFAILVQVSSLLAVLGTVTDLGIERALPRFIPEFEMTAGRAGLSRLLRNVALVKTLTILPFVALLLLFPDLVMALFGFQTQQARVFHNLREGDWGPLLLAMVALMLLLGAASDVSIQVLYAYFRQKATGALDVLNTFIPVLQAAIVLLLTWGVVGALLALLIGTAISVALSVRLMFRALGQERLAVRELPARNGAGANGRTPHRPSNRSIWQRFGAYSAMMYLMNLSTLLYDQSFVVLIVGLLVANSDQQRVEVALIALAFKFVRQLLQALVVPLTGVQTPLFSRLYAENRMEGLRTAYASLTRFLILALLPAGAGLIIMAQPLLVLLYGQSGPDAVLSSNYPERLPHAVLACAILTVGLFGESLVSVALNVLMVHEDYRAVLIARAFALLSVPLLLLLEPPLGVVGVAIAVAVAALSSRLVALIFGLRRLGLRFPGAFLGRVTLATLPFVVVVGPLAFLLPTDPLPPLSLPWFGRAVLAGLLMLGAVLLFWVTFRRLGGLPAEDRQRFAGMRIPGIKRLLRYV